MIASAETAQSRGASVQLRLTLGQGSWLILDAQVFDRGIDARFLRTSPRLLRATLAQRIVDAFTTPLRLPDHALMLTVSAGIAVTEDFCADPEKLLRQADAAMYSAKRNGRDRAELFEDRRPVALRAAETV